MANIIEILVTAKNLTKAEFDKAVADAKAAGRDIGSSIAQGSGDELKKELPEKVEKPLEDSGRRGGQSAGKAAGGAISPLIIGAFAAAATVGPAAVLGATAVAVVGAGALITKGNQQLQESYAQLGQKAASAIQDAAAPLIPELYSSVQVLERGVAAVGPELKSVFAAVAPDVTAITGGLVALVSNTLPGVASGLRAIAPFARDIAVDFGKLGSGLGGFFGALGSGASGGMAGFTALSTAIERLLPDIGAIIGDLSNGLGPALHDVVAVADAAGAAFKLLADNLPPGAIRATAEAVGVLYAAFKIGTMAGAVAEGTKFTQFLTGTEKAAKGAATETVALGTAAQAAAAKSAAAGEAIATKTALATRAVGGLGAALQVATGPLGMIVAGAGILGNYLGDKFAHNVDISARALNDLMQAAATGSATAQDQVGQLAGFLNDLPWGKGTAGIAALDQQLTQLAQTNPAQAAQEYTLVANAWEKQGKSASDVAGMLPGYTQAVKDAAGANQQAGYAAAVALTPQQQFAAALITNQQQLAQSAVKAGENAQAALSFAGAQGGLNDATVAAIGDFTLAGGAASAYQTALDALYGKYQSYSDAQSTFTKDLDNASKGLKASKDGFDMSTSAGSANYDLMSRLATANENRAEALLKETGNQDAANQSLQAGALKIDALAKSAHFSQGQIDALNLALYGTKNIGDIKVSVSADTSGAYSQLHRLVNDINGSAAYVQVGVSGSGAVGGRQLLAHGGVTGAGFVSHAAAGGPRSNLTWVGEQGPELLPLPPGTQVHSNPDSMRMAAEAASGSGAQTIRLEFVGAASDPLWTLLREHIRVVGGNSTDSVQRVLGQTF